MALPAEFDLVTVYREYVYHDGSYPVGEVTFQPNVPRQRALVAGKTILPKLFTAEVDNDGRIEIPLPATDDPDITPAGWTYTVTERFTGGTRYDIDVPIGALATGLDLGTVELLPPSTGDPTAFVTLSAFNSSVGHIKTQRFDIREYGAVGDDATDNTPAIQEALDAAEAVGGGTVVIPPGVYRSGPLLIAARCRIVGAGFGSVLKAKSGSTTSLIKTEATSVDLVEVSDLTLDCWGQAAGSGACGIELTSDSVGYSNGYPDAHHSLEDLFIVGTAGAGVKVASGCREIRCHNVQVRDPRAGHGFDLQGTDNFYSMCTAATTRAGFHGFYIHGSNNRFVGCKAFYCGAVTEASDGFFNDRGRNSFSSCEAQDNGRWGFQFSSGSDGCIGAALLADSNGAGGIKADNASGTVNGLALQFTTYSRSGGRYAQPIGIQFQGSQVGNTFIGTAQDNATKDVDGIPAGAIALISSSTGDDGSSLAGFDLVQSDTGWRDVASLVAADFEVAGSVPMLRLRRQGVFVTALFRVRSAAASSGVVGAARPLITMPTGFVPASYSNLGSVAVNNSALLGSLSCLAVQQRLDLCVPGSTVAVVGGTTSWAAQVTWVTNDAWPSSLPGVAV